MDWNDIGWKCKRQKKLIDFLILLCITLIGVIIYLHVTISDVRYTTMADLAAEAAVHTYWRDMNDYEVRKLSRSLEHLNEEYNVLEEQLTELLNVQ